MAEPHSPLTRKLISDGLKPQTTSADRAELRRQFHAAAMHVLERGAPGLAEASRNALASAIAIRCEGVIHRQERAA